MRIRVLGDCPTANALRGNLASAGFRVSDSMGMHSMGYTVHIQEYGGVYIHIDGIDCELERQMVNSIANLTETPLLLQRAGGCQSDREIRIRVTQDDNDQKAVELGILRGLLRTVGLEKQPRKPLNVSGRAVGMTMMATAIVILGVLLSWRVI